MAPRIGTGRGTSTRSASGPTTSRLAASGYIYDDAGNRGGLKPGELFVIAGDQNSDPLDGDSIPGSIQQLIEHPLVNTKVTPESAGAVEAAQLQGGANLAHRSDPRFDTADFADGAPGNLRADYVLPRKTLQIADAGVFWPSWPIRCLGSRASSRSRAPITGRLDRYLGAGGAVTAVRIR